MIEGIAPELDEATLLYNATGEVKRLKKVLANKMEQIKSLETKNQEFRIQLDKFIGLKSWQPEALDRYLNEVRQTLAKNK